MKYLIALALGAFGLYVLYSIISHLSDLQKYKSHPISNMKSGDLVYLAGQFYRGSTMLSPITQTPCVRWRILVTENQGTKDHKAVSRLDLSSKQPFSVMDNKGSTIEVLSSYQQDIFAVRVGNYRLSDLINWGKPHYQVHQHLFRKLTDERVIAFLNDHNINLTGFLGSRCSLHIQEYIGQTGDPIYIFGKVSYQGGDPKMMIFPKLISRRSRPYVIINIIFSLGLFSIIPLLMSFLLLSS